MTPLPDVATYSTEAAAAERAAQLTKLWERSDGCDGFNAVAVWSESRRMWIVRRSRTDLPGTCV